MPATKAQSFDLRPKLTSEWHGEYLGGDHTTFMELERLQKWYESNCDGYGEHQYGVTIDTFDNPGWKISIDLRGTNLEDLPFEFQDIERKDDNWLHCRVIDKKFEGAGGPYNLTEILRVFLDWAESQSRTET